MFRRLLSTVLICALTMSVCIPALGESGVSAGDILFGGAADMNAGTSSMPEQETEEGLEDEYLEYEPAPVTQYETLKVGDSDQADGAARIVLLQNRLIFLGFLKGSADGTYGPTTETAVEQFQKFNGLEQTGIADVETQQKLFSDVSTLATPSPENPAVYGSEAIRVQTRMAEWGFLTGSVDGVLGSGSEDAISDFKNYIYNIAPELMVTPSPEPTAVPTPEPTLAPDEMGYVDDEPRITPEPPVEKTLDGTVDETVLAFVDGHIPFEVYRQTVQNGDKNEEARRVQTRLKQLNYLYPNPDGAFGPSTELALKYFQRKNGLPENGVADEATQTKLFSSNVLKSEEYVFPYKLVVDISDQRVYVYGWDGDSYSDKVRKMVCSTGKDKTPTPLGTYQAYGRRSGEWFYFKDFNCYAKWAYGIVGGILFHSVTYSASKKLNSGSVHNLGRKASHGCVRLEVDDAKWIWDHCPGGTTVVVQE